jgi:hypothetical protein
MRSLQVLHKAARRFGKIPRPAIHVSHQIALHIRGSLGDGSVQRIRRMGFWRNLYCDGRPIVHSRPSSSRVSSRVLFYAWGLKRKSELASMQDRLLNAYLAGTVNEAVYKAKSSEHRTLSDVKLVTTKRKPFDVFAERPQNGFSRGDWRSFEPLIGAYVDAALSLAPEATVAARLMRLSA